MVALSSLPQVFSAGIPSIRWPLQGDNCCPPLLFQSLEELKPDRNPQGLQALGEDALRDLPGTLESMFPNSNDDKRHFGLISLALVLIGNGYTDECHNLITPLSWPDDIHFAHGPSIYSQVSPAAQAFATQVHSLVHRREAFHVGEFGMVGFANANFWSNAVRRSKGIDALPNNVAQEIWNLAQDYKDNAVIQDWCQKHDITPTGSADIYGCSRAIHDLCATVLRGNDSSADPLFVDFTERVAEVEVRVLLSHALERAGYSVDDDAIMKERQTTTKRAPPSKVNLHIKEDVALGMARKVSYAHLQNFQSNGCIVLRRVVDENEVKEDDILVSAAAGIACQLLQCAACKIGAGVTMIIPTATELNTAELVEGPINNMDVFVGDAFAIVSSSLSAAAVKSGEKKCDIMSFQACDQNDPEAVFVDKLYGSRGETPTTVIQWSKGTIF